jgi:hypothetical protein
MMHETNAAIEPFYLKPAIRRTNSFSFILDVMCFTWLLVAGVRNGDKAWHDDSRCTGSSCTCSVADLCYCLQTPVPSRVRAALRWKRPGELWDPRATTLRLVPSGRRLQETLSLTGGPAFRSGFLWPTRHADGNAVSRCLRSALIYSLHP